MTIEDNDFFTKFYICMKYYPTNLEQIIATKSHILNSEYIKKFALDMISVLAVMQDLAISHRDLKPSNVLV